MSEIRLESLSKLYPGDVLAVDDVSLTIDDGEFVSLVGPSGCGKTTTLRMIAGFEQPTRGQVHIGDDDVTALPPYRRDTGMVFQNFALFPHMTVADNVAYGLTVDGSHTQEEIDARVAEMLDLVQLPELGDRMPDQLSGGQQQRVALARALAPEPKVLLLDEPLASLDKKLRERMQVELREIQKQVGITTVFVTHNQEEALTMSDRIAVMNEGEFEQVGSTSEVYEQPESRFVADFVGTANFFDGQVAAVEGGQATVESGDLRLRAPTTNGFGPGDEVTIAVRPESVEFGIDADAGDENVVAGRITFERLLGSTVEYHVEADDGRTVIVVQKRGEGDWTAGDVVTLRLPSANCLLLEGGG